jgi:hypothetical protein
MLAIPIGIISLLSFANGSVAFETSSCCDMPVVRPAWGMWIFESLGTL